MSREMSYVSDYEEFRRSDARDTEARAEMKRDRAEEIAYPNLPPRRMTVHSLPVRPMTDCEICAYCGETARRCECWL